jgi:hypothetical protein
VTIRQLLIGIAFIGGVALCQPLAHAQSDEPGVSAEEPPPPPPPPPESDSADTPPPPPPESESAGTPPPPPPPESDSAETPPPPPPPESDSAGAPPPQEGSPEAQPAEFEPLQPGEAVVTRFSNTSEEPDETGKPRATIDLNGTSASIIDIRRPGDPPSGQHWIDEPQRLPVSAGEVGQVFGVAIDDLDTPDIFLSATAAFGLHRVKTGANQSDWMAGMWGPDAGPGTIYRLDVDNGYEAEKFSEITLDGRPNSGAALGNIAYDRWHKQLFVSDLETGMIHRIDADSGQDLGHYDHGLSGRVQFLDAWTGQSQSLSPVGFNPSTSARIGDCFRDFDKTPECWNIADFRRRIWGVGVRRSETGETRLYYAVWGSDALGNPEWVRSGDDRRNSVWSIGIKEDGDFDQTSVKRELFMPAFWPSTPDEGDKAGNSNPVSDIVFPECGPQNVMILSERGGMRNLGLDQLEPFARPHESRVLRYEIGSDGIWRPKGRYDVGFYDRSKLGKPYIYANSAGGADFGYGFDDNGSIDISMPDRSLWMTGDSLCSPDGPCTSMATGEHDDSSQVHGVQGSPADGYTAVEPNEASAAQPAAVTPRDFGVLDKSYMIDTDINVGENGEPDPATLARNDATKIGDIAIYQMCQGAPPLPAITPPPEGGDQSSPPQPPEGPVHTLAMSHEKWASSGHNVSRSWHQRNASWHEVERSWHWKSQSWHSVNRSWHWRGGSWHETRRSWHWKSRSWHTRDQSWHWREGSWHQKPQSWHRKESSFHSKVYSWHWKGQSWHLKGHSYHDKSRSWGNDHVKGRTWHQKGRSWGGEHVKGRSSHVKGRTWGGGEPHHVSGRSYHNKGKTWGGGEKPRHVKERSYHNKGQTWGGKEPKHSKKESQQSGGGKEPKHSKKESQQSGGGKQPKHSKRESQQSGGGKQPKHSKRESQQSGGGPHGGGKPQHSKGLSRQQTGGGGGQPVHNRHMSRQQSGGGQPVHNRHMSRQQSGGGGGEPVHNRHMSRQQSGGSLPLNQGMGQGSHSQGGEGNIYRKRKKFDQQYIVQ